MYKNFARNNFDVALVVSDFARCNESYKPIICFHLEECIANCLKEITHLENKKIGNISSIEKLISKIDDFRYDNRISETFTLTFQNRGIYQDWKKNINVGNSSIDPRHIDSAIDVCQSLLYFIEYEVEDID